MKTRGQLWLLATALLVGASFVAAPSGAQGQLTEAEQRCSKAIGEQGAKYVSKMLNALNKCQNDVEWCQSIGRGLRRTHRDGRCLALKEKILGPCGHDEPRVKAADEKAAAKAQAMIQEKCAGVDVGDLSYPFFECPNATTVQGVIDCYWEDPVLDLMGVHRGKLRAEVWRLFWKLRPLHWPLCGNTILDPGEQCDDGNLIDCDGCDSNCTHSFVCGNSILCGPEQCDDGNLVDGDGCDSNCTLTACGNGIVTAEEQCEDGNTLPGDGCSSTCQCEESVCSATGTWVSSLCSVTVTEDDAGNISSEGSCAGLSFIANGFRRNGTSCLELNVAVSGLGNFLCRLTQSSTCDRIRVICPDIPFDETISFCGNDVREGTEHCDGSDLAGQSCVSLGFTGGTLSCTANCTFDTSGCTSPPSPFF